MLVQTVSMADTIQMLLIATEHRSTGVEVTEKMMELEGNPMDCFLCETGERMICPLGRLL